MLPHPAGPRPAPRPGPGQRPLLPEAGLILEPDRDFLARVVVADGLDLIRDDRLEDGLPLLVGVLVLRPGHQALEAVAVEPIGDRLEAEAHAELRLEDPLQVAAAEGPGAIRGGRPGLEPLLEAEQSGPGQAGRPPGVGPLGPRLRPAAVGACDPVLDGADAAAEGLGDLGGGVALGGEDDGLVAEPDPLAGDGLGEPLEFCEGQGVVDMPGAAPGGDSGASS
jgi:hypothetical protein